jgi:hypothetical protein
MLGLMGLFQVSRDRLCPCEADASLAGQKINSCVLPEY